MLGIEWVDFDVGETLVDETRYWRQWADRLRLPEFTWFGILGGVIARGLDHREAFRVVDPSFDLVAALNRYEADGMFGPGERWWSAQDFYADVLPSLAQLRLDGYRLGIAANNSQADRAALTAQLARCGIHVDLHASSAAWNLWKPDVLFFRQLAQEAAAPPERIVYVGDRVDNDVLPARAEGLHPVFLRRGPWGYLQQAACPSDVPTIDSLDMLPDLLSALTSAPPSG